MRDDEPVGLLGKDEEGVVKSRSRGSPIKEFDIQMQQDVGVAQDDASLKILVAMRQVRHVILSHVRCFDKGQVTLIGHKISPPENPSLKLEVRKTCFPPHPQRNTSPPQHRKDGSRAPEEEEEIFNPKSTDEAKIEAR
jgi:hypothetical protein